MKLTFSKLNKSFFGKLSLVASKSESNRILLIKAVSELPINLVNISKSKDTETLRSILELAPVLPKKNSVQNYDIENAGTCMRFLTALFASKLGLYVITGSSRMKNRPIKHLVDALLLLGADIEYLGANGNPPLRINGKVLSGGQIDMDGSVSSQFTSALLMVAPFFSNGLVLNFKKELVSAGYIEMTVCIMKRYAIDVEILKNKIVVKPGAYKILDLKDIDYCVEGDWSAASYLYSLVALSDYSEIEIEGLKENSFQPDSICALIFSEFGVKTEYLLTGIKLTKIKVPPLAEFNYNFNNCPDLAQTLAVVCAAKKIKAKLSGLRTLRFKETDRIIALQTEFLKFGIKTESDNDDVLKIYPELANFSKIDVEIETYQDHRMAMSFAPLALMCKSLTIKNIDVVEKSWPSFWEDLRNLGFDIS